MNLKNAKLFDLLNLLILVNSVINTNANGCMNILRIKSAHKKNTKYSTDLKVILKNI